MPINQSQTPQPSCGILGSGPGDWSSVWGFKFSSGFGVLPLEGFGFRASGLAFRALGLSRQCLHKSFALIAQGLTHCIGCLWWLYNFRIYGYFPTVTGCLNPKPLSGLLCNGEGEVLRADVGTGGWGSGLISLVLELKQLVLQIVAWGYTITKKLKNVLRG